MQDNRNIRMLKKIMLLLPLCLGTTGLMAQGISVLDALFSAVQMYTLGYSEGGNAPLVEIARWMAPLATAGGIVMAVRSLQTRLSCFFTYHRGNSVAVYGDSEEKSAFLARLDNRGMDPGDRFVKANSYVLLDNEEKNFAFYNQYRDRLADAQVYLKCSSLSPQHAASENLHLYSPEESAARLFWKSQSVYRISRDRNHRMDIALIGFDRLGEELLLYGLQYNIFHPEQAITYHVFGGDAGFLLMRPGMARLTDQVVIHDAPWFTQLPMLEQAAMILVTQQHDRLNLLRQLTLALPRQQFHVFAPAHCGLELMDHQDQVQTFDWTQPATDPENLFLDTLNLRARRLNLRYAHLYSGVEETEANERAQWSKLDPFTRYSNISSADYHEVQQGILRAEGISPRYSQIPDMWKERLSELEHIRWCRYHYLNNWSYGIPANGARKDPKARIHASLADYQCLSESEKDKDRENIRVLFTIEED